MPSFLGSRTEVPDKLGTLLTRNKCRALAGHLLRSQPMTHSTRGFSLIEITITGTILGVVGSLAIPHFGELQARSEDEAVARVLLANLRWARSKALARATLNPRMRDPDPVRRLPRTIRLGHNQSAGVEVQTPSSYFVFQDDNIGVGGEQTLKRVDFTDTRLRFVERQGTQIRFVRHHSARQGGRLTLEDQDTGKRFFLEVTMAGIPRLRER